MIRWFKDVGSEHLPLVGGKGANLGECAAAGFPVPPGFIVDTNAYAAAMQQISAELIEAAEKQDSERAQQLVNNVEIPVELRAEVEQAYAALGDVRVAVRSSATAEDLAEASFAGQQDTFLGVSGVDALWDAIRGCWASLWNERAVSYRRKHGVSDDGLALAVVVQTMIAADASGVLFTRDPLADSTDMIISASYGLGESVVAALVTPDTFTVSREPVRIVAQTISSKATRIDMSGLATVTSPVAAIHQAVPCIEESDIQRLVALGKQVEEHYGTAQDIEWAFAKGELYLLQARPITTVATTTEGHYPVRTRIERTFRDDLMEHYPAPYPLDLVAVHALQDSVQDSMRMIGLKVPSAVHIIEGDDAGIIRINARAPRLQSAMVLRLPQAFVKGMRHDPQQWAREEQEAQVVRARLAQRVASCADAPNAEVVALLDDVLAQAAQLMSDRFLYYLAPMTVLRSKAEAMIWLSRQKDTVTTEDLYDGLDYVTADVLAGIRDLATTARQTGLAEVFTATPAEQLEDVLNAEPRSERFLDEVDAFLRRRGARTACMYLPFSHESWRERPQGLYELVAVAVRGHNGDEPQVKGSAAETVEAHLPRLLRGSWRKTVATLRALHVGREGTLYAIEEVLVLARAVMGELIRRLVDRGMLGAVDDAPYLYFHEIVGALRGDADFDGVDLCELIAARKRQRGVAEAVWWDRGEASDNVDAIKGVPGSSGQVVGTARIIRTPADFGRLQPGDILVCPFTDPTWTPLFEVAAAVVADIGGPLSHAAIVAREYGIPAVLGTGDATARIQDGDKILVDGQKGSVVQVSTA